MADHYLTTPSPPRATLGALPSEVLQNIFYFATSISFFQLIQVNRKFFDAASQARQVILHHLHQVPGIKLGLDDRSISTYDLFLIFRQRAASNLYGVHFTADCRNFEPASNSPNIFDPLASCLAGDSKSCVTAKNSATIELNLQSHAYGHTIDSPYADGRSKIVQIVKKGSYVSVLYAWEQPEKEPAEDISHPEPTIALEPPENEERKSGRTRDGLRYKPKRSHRKKSSNQHDRRVHYHLLHYDLYRGGRPIFFPIPTHKSCRGTTLAPVHLAVYNRVQCAILWDLPHSTSPSVHATVCLYKAEFLPLNVPGHYEIWVIYPFDHPASYPRSGPYKRDGPVAISDSDNEQESRCVPDRPTYTYTKINQLNDDGTPSNEYDSDLRLLHAPLKPRAISFFKDGRRLALYAPGLSSPYTILLAHEAIRSRMNSTTLSPEIDAGILAQWPRSFCRRVRRSNQTILNGRLFHLSLPFFSKHETILRPVHNPDLEEEAVENDCITNLLCLATAVPGPVPSTTVPVDRGVEVLTIVQVRRRIPYDDCLHSGAKDDFPTGMPPPPPERRRRRSTPHPFPGVEIINTQASIPDAPINNGDNNNNNHNEPDLDVEIFSDSDDDFNFPIDTPSVRVVAHLWGYNKQSTTLTGLETISVSPRGERIAVAQWDRVLIYALNPTALCEEVWDDEVVVEENQTENGDDTASTISEFGNNSSDGSTVDHSVGAIGASEHSVNGDEPADQEQVAIAEADPMDENQNALTAGQALPEAPPLGPGAAVTVPPPPASALSSASTSVSEMANFYPHVKEGVLGNSLVLLRPIELKMQNGAVIHKMSWGVGRTRDHEDDEYDSDSTDEDNERASEAQTEERQASEAANVAETPDSETQAQQDGNQIVLSAAAATNANLRVDDDNEHNVEEAPSTSDLAVQDAVDTVLAPKSLSPEASSRASQSGTLPQTVIHEFARGDTEDVPPAPFSDLKLTGQIKHIDRPPEYYHFLNKISLELPGSGSIDLVPPTLRSTPVASVADAQSNIGSREKASQEVDEKAVSMSTGQELENGVGEEPSVGLGSSGATLAMAANEADPATTSEKQQGREPEYSSSAHQPQPAGIDSTLDTGTQSDPAASVGAGQTGGASPAISTGPESPTIPDHPYPALNQGPLFQAEETLEVVTERGPVTPTLLNTDMNEDFNAQKPRIYQPRTPRRRKHKRVDENELTIMTDRGIQVWDLSVWGTGRRKTAVLDID
jgi:hypothetical protein